MADEMNIQELGGPLPTDPGMAGLEIKKWTGHSDYLNPVGKYHGEISGRVEKLYSIVHPEPEGRGAEGETQGISDILRKEGLDTVEKIEAEGERGREEIFENKAIQDAVNCETALKLEWGNAGYDEKLKIAKFFYKEYFSEDDRSWSDFTPDTQGAVSPSNDPKFISMLTDLGQYISGHNKKFDAQLRKYFAAKIAKGK